MQDVYNFLLDSGMDPVSTTTSAAASNTHLTKYSRYLSNQEAASDPNAIGGIMNGVVKQKLKIIPGNLTWQELSYTVYGALKSEIMKPRIDEVSELSDQRMEFGDVFLKNGMKSMSLAN
jgi:serine carboxypeptidase 1